MLRRLVMYEENKELICDLLCVTLKYTRNLFDLEALKYDVANETVTATFRNGGTRVINVAGDSGTAMIRDIMNGL